MRRAARADVRRNVFIALASTSLFACAGPGDDRSIDPPAGADGYGCTAVGCTSGVTWVVHLPTAVTYGTSDDYSATICHEGDCATAEPIPYDAAFAIGTTFRADVSFFALQQGTVEVYVSVPGHGVDGEAYDLFLAGPNGVDVVSLERRAILGEPYYPNGRRCDEPQGYWCRGARFDVWPGSASDLTCTGYPVVGGAEMRIGSTFRPSQWAYASLTFCRDDLCASTTFDAFPCYPGSVVFGGAIAQVVWDCENGEVSNVVVSSSEDPVRLTNGDRYHVYFTNPTGTKTFYEWQGIATYDETYPNGPVCDAHPSRTATFDLP
jgi:hypothetical protein